MSLFSLAIQRGDRASQPAANSVIVGTLYFVTDENVTERSDGSNWESYSGDANGIQFTETTVTNAEILDLFNTPIECVPAPGAGFALFPLAFYININAPGGDYGGSRELQMTMDSQNLLLPPEPTFFQTSQNYEIFFQLKGNFEDQPIMVTALVGNPTGGNVANSMYIRTYFMIVPVL